MIPVLTTGRLTLRPPVVGDAEALTLAINDWEVVQWLSVVPYPYTRDDAEWFLSECEAGREASWAICDADGLCGMIGTTDTGLGYWLARRVWGQGYATEAGCAVLRHYFANPVNYKIRSGHFEDNAGSAKVLRKLGFMDVGAKMLPCVARGQDVPSRDMLLTRDTWEARHG
ncbi:GNAT family N-acetyltransferase [Marivivens marinus]|uniref:GNAT family N-acetyltransferase n=1 Tax=Marivivens marinus TaxID=3110173 RepID=UPI003B84B654